MSKNNPLLSIIVPVYNSEDYLETAFNTVMSQSFADFELILVNDGSTDESASVCERFAQTDNRVKYYSKKNGGLCSARNYGIDRATGKYIMFMDNDDAYYEDAFKIIADTIDKYGADIIRFNRKRIQIFDDNTQKEDVFGTRGITDGEPVILSRQEFFENYVKMRKSGCFAGIWNAAFKRELFNEIRFDETITAGGEDAIVNLQLYEIFNSIVFIPDVLYIYYRRTKHSISTQFKENHIVALGKMTAIERRLVHDNGLGDDEYFAYIYVHIASLVKELNHKNSNLTPAERYKILDGLKSQSYGFDFDADALGKSKISFAKKAYIGLYVKRRYRILFAVTNAIMRIRGNI